MPIVVSEIADLTSRVGEHLGWSRWHTVTQDEVDHFAEATGNRGQIHTDPEFAKATPYGGTIAYGIQILAMATMLLEDVWDLRATNGVDCGSNKVRHLTPVPVGAAVRLGVTVNAATEVPATDAAPAGVQTTLGLTFEVEGSQRPACVAEIVFIYWF